MKNISVVGRRSVGRKNVFSEVLEPRVLLSSYDAVKDFSATAMNGSGVWTYGVRSSEFADFAAFAVATPLDFAPNSTIGWNENSGSPPYVGINTTGAEFTSEGIDLPTNVLVMHPGGNGEYADLRFTVPQSGDVTVDFEFEGIDINNTTTDVHVLYNNASVFDGSINNYHDSVDTEPPLTIPNATQGGIIDFVVGDGSNGNFFNDATSLSAQIKTAVANDHLVFSQQPKDGTINAPVTTQVKAVDSHGRIDKSVPDGVSLFLNVPAGSSAKVTNAPFVYAPFFNGVATFAPLQSPFIDTPGTYTLTAVANNSPAEQFGTPGVDSAVSKSFMIGAPHLVFTQQPKNAESNSPFAFTVELLNAKHKPAFAAGQPGDAINIVIVTGDGAHAYSESSAPLVGSKYNNLAPPDGSAPITIADEGPFEIAVGAYDPSSANQEEFTDRAVSKVFTVFNSHLALTRQPSTAAANAPLTFTVLLEDFRNRRSTLSSLLVITLTPVSGSGAFANTGTGSTNVVMVSGRYNNRAITTTTPLAITAPGTYTLTVQVADSTGVPLGLYEPVTSKNFKIK